MTIEHYKRVRKYKKEELAYLDSQRYLYVA